MKIVFTKGIQGSGKSTWAKEFCIKNHDWVRVSRDDIRNMRGQYWIPKDEDMITVMEDTLIRLAYLSGKNVIVDAMNLNNDRTYSRVDTWRNDGWFDGEIEFEDFTSVPLKVCQERNLIRPNSIDPDVIKSTWDKYLAPVKAVYLEDGSLPHCVIFDVDGTLAKMNGRGPFEWGRVSEDLVNKPVKQLFQAIYNGPDHVKLIIFTGRDGVCESDTRKWLIDNNINFDRLFIRPAGDSRKDSVVKRELFDNHIRGKYYVDFVVDDRDQVVEMWRKELGLPCFQVDYGNF